MTPEERPQVFVSYASEDVQTVRRLCDELIALGVRVWFDKLHLGPGRWRQQIRKAVPQSRFFLICLSEVCLRKLALGKPPFVDEELSLAFDIATSLDAQSFMIVPVRLEDCARRRATHDVAAVRSVSKLGSGGCAAR